MAYKREIQIGGKTLSMETGALARQANGAVVVRYGDTVVIATACYKDGNVIGDFMPLTVDYKEYTYAGGSRSAAAVKPRMSEKNVVRNFLLEPSVTSCVPDRMESARPGDR